MNSAETTMFATSAAEDREAEIVHNAQCDRQTMERAYWVLKTCVDMLFERKVTLCDAGCMIDIEAIVEGFRPHDAARVERAARELAKQEAGCE